MTSLQISNFTSANRCYFKNLTGLFTSMECWAKRPFVRSWKDGLLTESQARMSRGCRLLLFWHHSYEVTLTQGCLTRAIDDLQLVHHCTEKEREQKLTFRDCFGKWCPFCTQNSSVMARCMHPFAKEHQNSALVDTVLLTIKRCFKVHNFGTVHWQCCSVRGSWQDPKIQWTY